MRGNTSQPPPQSRNISFRIGVLFAETWFRYTESCERRHLLGTLPAMYAVSLTFSDDDICICVCIHRACPGLCNDAPRRRFQSRLSPDLSRRDVKDWKSSFCARTLFRKTRFRIRRRKEERKWTVSSTTSSWERR